MAETEVVLKYDVKNTALLGGGFMPIKLNNITATTPTQETDGPLSQQINCTGRIISALMGDNAH